MNYIHEVNLNKQRIRLLKPIVLVILIMLVVSGCSSTSSEEIISPAPVTTQATQQPSGQNNTYSGEPLFLYELSDDTFTLPRTSIPYYRNGQITFLDDEIFTQYSEGHQPWLSSGIDVVTTVSSNLTGEQKPFLDIDYSDHSNLKTPSGILIKEITNEKIELHVPNIGKYEFTLKSPQGTEILFISRIVLYPR